MSASTCASKIEESRVEYNDQEDGTVVEGFLCVPKLTSKQKGLAMLPSVLVYPHFAGVDEFTEEKCRSLAKLGFVAFAADMYGKGIRFKEVPECRPTLTKFHENRQTLCRRRILAAFERLKAFDFVNQQKIAAIGYCFGGMCALDLARLNVPGLQAVVTFHGTLKPLPVAADEPPLSEQAPLSASVLICHGDADPHIPAEQCSAFMAEMRERKADWQFVSYGNAKHAFTVPDADAFNLDGVGYDARTDKCSWEAMLHLLKEKL